MGATPSESGLVQSTSRLTGRGEAVRLLEEFDSALRGAAAAPALNVCTQNPELYLRYLMPGTMNMMNMLVLMDMMTLPAGL